MLTFLLDAYRVDEAPTAKGDTEKRTVLGLHRDLAPIKVAVLPLSRNETLVPEARRVFDLVKAEWMCQYDDAGAIGRRYRRQDEVGTPFCVTVDFDSLEDRQVTVRERDTMAQERLPIDNLVGVPAGAAVSDAGTRSPRGSFALYVVAFVLMVAAGVALVASAKGFLESTRLLWVSAALSAGAIVVALVGLFVPRRRSTRRRRDRRVVRGLRARDGRLHVHARHAAAHRRPSRRRHRCPRGPGSAAAAMDERSASAPKSGSGSA